MLVAETSKIQCGTLPTESLHPPYTRAKMNLCYCHAILCTAMRESQGFGRKLEQDHGDDIDPSLGQVQHSFFKK